jgi:hypothetical protein
MSLALLALALTQSSPDPCEDLARALADAVQGSRCADLATLRGCLADRRAWAEDLLDGGAPADLEERIAAQCGALEGALEDGGPPAALPEECLKRARETSLRTELRSSLDQLQAVADGLIAVCAEAAQRTAGQGAAEEAKIKQMAADTAAGELLRAHPELPAQAISAAVCRTEIYRKWVSGQIRKAAADLAAQRELQQLSSFLSEKEANAKLVLKTKFHRRRLSCEDRTIQLLTACTATPTLTDDQGDEYVKDPEQACSFDSETLEPYASQGWYLGIDWFQPTRLRQSKK